MQCNPYCPRCGEVAETETHCLLECPDTSRIWNLTGTSQSAFRQQGSLRMLLDRWMQIKDNKSLVRLVVTIWLIWKDRCGLVYEQKRQSPVEIAAAADSLTAECLHAFQNTKESSSVSSNNTRWLAPPAGTYTVNVDAYFSASGLAAFGIIIRDSLGAVIQAVSGRFHHILNIEHAEMKAILEGLKLARSLQLPKVIIYSDSALAVDRIRSTEEDLSFLSPIASQCRQESSFFVDVKFAFVRRQGNHPAHILAQLGLSLDTTCNWGAYPPQTVMLAVSADSLHE